MNKKTYGQFYTTNYEYILKDMYIPNGITNIIEPFAGNKDLLNFIHDLSQYTIELYDIDSNSNDIIKRDTLLEPPVYDNKFVLTNPPFLARNKSQIKDIFNKYKQNDLYKCFIASILKSNLLGGIIIIPLNFWCSIRKNDVLLRKEFLDKFAIIKLNIFEEPVFDDTKYTICSIQFSNTEHQINNIPTTIYPANHSFNFILDETNNYTIGGEIYTLPQSERIKIDRLTKNNVSSKNTNIKLYGLDSNSRNRIRLEIVDDEHVFVDNTENLSERTFATFVIHPKLSMIQQHDVVNAFNIYLNEMRVKYNSLFLSNYRESSDISRKRISFSLTYTILNHIITNLTG